jgi:hypothetical protein
MSLCGGGSHYLRICRGRNLGQCVSVATFALLLLLLLLLSRQPLDDWRGDFIRFREIYSDPLRRTTRKVQDKTATVISHLNCAEISLEVRAIERYR